MPAPFAMLASRIPMRVSARLELRQGVLEAPGMLAGLRRSSSSNSISGFQRQRRLGLTVLAQQSSLMRFVRDEEKAFKKAYELQLAEKISTAPGVLSLEKETAVKSPLTQLPAPESEKEGTAAIDKASASSVLNPVQRIKTKPKIVKAMRRDIAQSPIKMNLVAKLVRGMRVNDALLQTSVLVKRAAASVFKVLHSARANAVHNYGYDAEKLIVAECFVGKGKYLKRIWPHAKGKFGIRERKRCRVTVYLREMTEREEKALKMLRKKQSQGSYIYRTRLLPHRIMNTRWSLPRRSSEQLPENTEAQEN